ncbi:uncharacterized protein LOC8282438 [Ricinus communis]|uniref:Wound-responsive family protein n=1 Tax=Ricinus communis TaxID=3988 RepID=B9SIF2_RICCO|nr:uncharacterized protein LOC8282438 [Ricinus communis]EEF36607.1 conserved hypothetical protein [Ricinus communis]|eukprot:XP_002525771.1 uncharacterized protein LOC8282438 [Ricinus communis]
MSSTSRAWMVAASIGVVEALKDQGLCRWNYALRSIQQHAKTNIRSYSQANKKLSLPSSSSSSSSSALLTKKLGNDQITKSEESLRTVMYLSSWVPTESLPLCTVNSCSKHKFIVFSFVD